MPINQSMPGEDHLLELSAAQSQLDSGIRAMKAAVTF